MLIRYAMLMVAAATAVWGAINLSASNARMFLVDAGQGATGSIAAPNVSFWLLAGIAALITLSLCRFVIFGLPTMVDGWYQDHKPWLFTLIIGGLLYGFFYLM